MTDPTTTPTPTPPPAEPHHDVREEWAARLQCADVGVDFPWLTEDGCDVWHEQPVATQEHYRRLLDLALSAGLQIPPTAAVSAAAPDEREALSGEGLPERFRFSRKVYGDVADDATRVLLALTDGGHADHPSDYLRWVSITAAQALAARPVPTVSGERVAELRSRIAALVNPAGDPNPAWDIAVASIVHEVLAVFPVADAPAAEPEQAPERLCADCGHVEGVHACTFAAIRCAMCGCTAFRPAADDEGGQER